MSKYIARVILHGAREPEDYVSLHQHMEQAGFERTIKSDDGRNWHLPPGMYRADSALGVNRVREIAEEKAALTGFRYAVLAFDYQSASWNGLEQFFTIPAWWLGSRAG